MRKIRYFKETLLLIFFLLFVHDALCTTEEHVPTGTRPIGMGEAFTALADDSNSVRRNPAGLSLLDRYTFEFQRTAYQLFGALETNYLSLAMPASERTAFGLDWVQIGVDDDELQAKQNNFNFAYSLNLFNPLSVGVNLKYLTWSSSLDGQSKGAMIGWGTDVGALLKLGRQWRVGVFAQDFIGFSAESRVSRGTWLRHDTGIREQVFPTLYKFGIAYHPIRQWRIAADISDRLHIGTELMPNPGFALRAGLQKDRYTKEPPTYSFGGGIKYKWLNFNVAYQLPPTLPPTTYVGLSVNFDFRKLPVQIEHIRTRDLYPILYHYYANPNDAETIVLDDPLAPPAYTNADQERYYRLMRSDSIGRIWLKNVSDNPITVRIQLFINQFVNKDGTEVALEDIELPPRKRVSVPMRKLVLSSQALELAHAQPVEARVKVTESGGSAYRTATTTVYLHGNNTTQLDEVAKLASFIPSKDVTVHAFTDAVITAFEENLEQVSSTQRQFYLAMLLFNALYGISYKTDANIPFESGTVDTIKHPYEMLENLTRQISGDEHIYTFGDCDDSTALYCALLESIGIKTALIQLPGHVLMAFDLGGLSVAKAQELALPDAFYQTINGQVWIPVETTHIKDGFAVAWKKAVEQLQNSVELLDPVTTEDAWNKYGWGYPRGKKDNFSVSKEPIQERMKVDLTDEWLQELLEFCAQSSAHPSSD